MLVTIYCSGSIPKGPHDGTRAVWTDTERQQIASAAAPIQTRFFKPDDPVSSLDHTTAMFGRDMYQVYAADFVVVDARERRGIGIGIEMLASRVLETPLIVVAPNPSHYRKQELHFRGSVVHGYIHPHIAALADAVVESFEAAGYWIKKYCEQPARVKTFNAVFDAIEVYKQDVLHLDEPMVQLLLELEEVGRQLP